VSSPHSTNSTRSRAAGACGFATDAATDARRCYWRGCRWCLIVIACAAVVPALATLLALVVIAVAAIAAATPDGRVPVSKCS